MRIKDLKVCNLMMTKKQKNKKKKEKQNHIEKSKELMLEKSSYDHLCGSTWIIWKGNHLTHKQLGIRNFVQSILSSKICV